MENYKQHTISLGSSDVALLMLLGFKSDDLQPEILNLGGDGKYKAYVVFDSDCEIPSHYTLRTTFKKWLKVYDDEELVAHIKADTINIYRSGDYGVLIHIENLIELVMVKGGIKL